MKIDDKMEKDFERLNYATGGRIRAIADKITTIDNPILIIGLGGTGVNALLRTKRLIADRMELETNKDKPKNVDYLAIDTDENAFKGGYMGMKLSDDEKLVYKLSDIAGVVENRSTLMRDDIRKWFNSTVDVSLVRSGAGAYRQVGRFILFQNIERIRDALRNKISRIKKYLRKNDDDGAYIFVFSGIGGGTGSGTFIDMGYILQSVAANPDCNLKFRSFLFAIMPDVNLLNVKFGSADATNIKRNGFAALKELDYLNNLKVHGKSLTVNYGGSVSVTDTQKPPYEVTLFFSSNDANGNKVGYEDVMAVCSETVINFIADEQTNEGAKFTITSFLANSTERISAYEANLGTEKAACSYKYVVAGAASAYVPLDDLVSYFTYLIFDKMSKMWNKQVNKVDVDKVIKYINADVDSVYRILSTSCKVKLPDLENFKFEDFKVDNRGIINACETAFEKQKREVDDAIDVLVADIRKKINDKNNIIDQDYFLNMNYGPVVTQRMIYSDAEGVPTILKRCGDMKNDCGGKKEKDIVLTNLKDKIYKVDKIRNLGLLDNKKRVIKEHIEDIEKYYSCCLNNYIYESMEKVYDEIWNIFNEKNNAVYAKVKTIVEELHRLFKAYGDIITTSKEQVKGNSHVLSWNIINVPDFVNAVKNMMANDPNLAINLDNAVNGFYADFLNNIEKWTSSDNNSVVDQLNEYVSNLFKNIVNETLDSYIGSLAAQEGKNVNTYYDDIYHSLDRKATVLFNKCDGMQVGEKFSYMSIPENCDSMLSYFRERAGANDTIKVSALKDKIYKINYETCIPLMAYSSLEEYEEVYELCRKNAAIHLYETTDDGGTVDWREIPAPNPGTKWTTGHRASMKKNYPAGEVQKTEEYFMLFDKAKEIGYIYYENQNYYVLVDDKPASDLLAIIKEFGIDNIDSSYINPASAEKALSALKAVMHISKEKGEEKFDKACFRIINLNEDHSLIKDREQDEDYTKEYFYKNMTLRDEIKKQVEIYNDFLYYAKKLAEFCDGDIDNYTWMLNLYMTNTVRKTKTKMIVYKDKENVSRTIYNPLENNTRLEYFEVFNCLMSLEQGVKKYITEKSNKVLSAPTVEQFDYMLVWLQSFKEKIAEEYAYIKDNWQDIVKVEEKNAFYVQLKKKVDDRLNALGQNVEQANDDDDDDGGMYL